MLDLNNASSGASRETEEDELQDAIQAELILVLEDLRQRFDVDGSTLAWATHLAISRNLRAHEGIEAWAMWNQKMADGAADTHKAVLEILQQDAKQSGNLN